jgi:hypothetical protein
MTGNVAQAIVADSEWDATLRGISGTLRHNRHVVFETPDPAYGDGASGIARGRSVDGVRDVEHWFELSDMRLPCAFAGVPGGSAQNCKSRVLPVGG